VSGKSYSGDENNWTSCIIWSNSRRGCWSDMASKVISTMVISAGRTAYLFTPQIENSGILSLAM